MLILAKSVGLALAGLAAIFISDLSLFGQVWPLVFAVVLIASALLLDRAHRRFWPGAGAPSPIGWGLPAAVGMLVVVVTTAWLIPTTVSAFASGMLGSLERIQDGTLSVPKQLVADVLLVVLLVLKRGEWLFHVIGLPAGVGISRGLFRRRAA